MIMDQLTENADDTVVADPAATVIPLRDRSGNLEVLLIQRNPKLPFQGGAWVFPGGRVEQSDYSIGDDHDLVAAARRAAVRETLEESGLQVKIRDLIPVSHWTTPEGLPRRFATWFFVTNVGEQTVQIDGQETCDYHWYTPQDALKARDNGEIVLLPPTFICLLELSKYSTSEMALEAILQTRTSVYNPCVRPMEGGFCQLYEEDVAYDGRELDAPGTRHRLWALDTGWRYECSEYEQIVR